MLVNVHVKNFALIGEADLNFAEGLNILSGETGAGKSILIDAVNTALGGKAGKDVIRRGCDYALVELTFRVSDERLLAECRANGIEPDEYGQIIVTRKIMDGRSVLRVNDETMTITRMRQVTGLLIDICGQHEHQSLLHAARHLEILDLFASERIGTLKNAVSSCYSEYQKVLKSLEQFTMNEEERIRELDFLQYEIREIEQAAVKEHEEEELEARYRKLQHARTITENMNHAAYLLGYDSEESAGEQVSRAVREISQAAVYDEELKDIESQCSTIDDLLGDLNRSISDYISSLEVNEEEFFEIEKRLDVIRGIEAKYGRNYALIQESYESRKNKAWELENYEENRKAALRRKAEKEQELDKLCAQLSAIRKEEAKPLAEAIRQALLDLNFLHVDFEMAFERTSGFTRNGYDTAQFLISTNPGEEKKPLGQVASGGELSRIMLAIKAVLAETDSIPTLIFDEIDAGISGRTAQMVSEKLARIARSHQVLCITHLPQIAAMADAHYRIEKGTADGRTATSILRLDEEGMLEELSRMIGGVSITDAVRETAREMKHLAAETKKEL